MYVYDIYVDICFILGLAKNNVKMHVRYRSQSFDDLVRFGKKKYNVFTIAVQRF